MARMSVKKISDAEKKSLGIDSWPKWSKEVSTFLWSYSDKETAYILEGDVTVTANNGESISFGPGDLVTFEAGLDCTWDVKIPLLKHYQFG
jgi:uncharacterized cupin superfamily protein